MRAIPTTATSNPTTTNVITASPGPNATGLGSGLTHHGSPNHLIHLMQSPLRQRRPRGYTTGYTGVSLPNSSYAAS